MTDKTYFFVILIVATIIVVAVAISMWIFSRVMLKQKRQLKKEDYPNCPEIIFNRYLLWHTSFIWWTILTYTLIIIPLFTSVATIYFATDFLTNNDRDTVILLSFISFSPVGYTLMSFMSFISALLPLINSKLQPKMHMDGFYKGAVLIEQGIIKQKEGLINAEQLINIAEKAEKYTNPTLDLDE